MNVQPSSHSLIIDMRDPDCSRGKMYYVIALVVKNCIRYSSDGCVA